MSTRLRETTREQADVLLSESLGVDGLRAAVQQLFGTDPVLIDAILEVVTDVQKLDDWLAGREEVEEKCLVSEEAADLLWRMFCGPKGLEYVPDLYGESRELADLLDSALGFTTSNSTKSNGRPWWDFIGHEKTIIAILAAPLNKPGAVQEICEWLLWATELGIFGNGWRYHDFKDATIPSGPFPKIRMIRNQALVHHTAALPESMEPYLSPDLSLSKAEFIAAIEAIMRGNLPQIDIATNVSAFADTILLKESATYLLSGIEQLRQYGDLYTDNHLASSLQPHDLNADGLFVAKQQIINIKDLDQLLASGVDSEFPKRGINVTAMVDHLREQYSSPIMHLSAAEFKQIWHFNHSSSMNEALSRADLLPEMRGFYEAVSYIVTLLLLIDKLHLDNPARAASSTKLTRLKQYLQEKIGHFVIDTMDLGCYYDSPQFYRVSRGMQTIRVLTEEHLDRLISSLNIIGPAGDPHDPLNSAPEVVVEVERHFGVSTDSARYFLQVLSLARPTDSQVQAWNSWDCYKIDQAAQPLRGILLEAKRPGACRRWFLPGAWLEQDREVFGLEAWKAPHYLLWRSRKASPIVRGCPPLCSLDQLFADAWACYVGGDVPSSA